VTTAIDLVLWPLPLSVVRSRKQALYSARVQIPLFTQVSLMVWFVHTTQNMAVSVICFLTKEQGETLIQERECMSSWTVVDAAGENG